MNLLQITNAITPDTIKLASKVPATTVHHLSFLDLMMKGGVLMIPLGILAICALYIIIERWIFIASISRVNTRQIDDVKNMLLEGKLDSALSICRSTNKSIFRILEIGIKRLGHSIKDIESSIETANLIEVTRMSKKLGYLGVIAGVAPMLGFIGTIVGIIQIFYSISLADNISIGIIAEGLYVKMITSFSGLLIGVVAYAGYHLMNIMIDRFVSKAEIQLFSFINLLQDPADETNKK